MKKTLILTSLVLLNTAYAQDGGIRAPMGFENANVLPVKIRNVRFMNSEITANDKYNDNSSVVEVGAALNKDVTWEDSIKSKKTDMEKAKLRAALKDAGISEKESLGETTGEASIAVQAQVPVIAYGVTPKLTMALAIPYITTDVDMATGFEKSDSSQRFGSYLQKQNKHKPAYKLKRDTLNATVNKLEDNGYEQPTHSRESRLGDIRLISKYQMEKNDKSAWGFKFDITAPTGEPTRVSRIVDVGTGDGQWDVGVGVIGEYSLRENLVLTGFAGHTVQMPTQMDRRIYSESDSKVTSDIEKDTDVDFGDISKVEGSLKFLFANGLSLTNGLIYQEKQADNYNGTDFSQSRYGLMERETAQTMHVYQGGFGFSTVPLFRQGKFKVPLEANLFYTSIYDGRNVIKSDITTFELALFF